MNINDKIKKIASEYEKEFDDSVIETTSNSMLNQAVSMVESNLEDIGINDVEIVNAGLVIEETKEADKKEAVAPEGYEHVVKKLKKEEDVDNPWAVAWWMKNKGYKPKASITVKTPKFEGVILATLEDWEDNVLKKLSYDNDDIFKAYNVDLFVVDIPTRGRYFTSAIDESKAIDRVIPVAYGAGEIQDLIFQKQMPMFKESLLKENKVRRASDMKFEATGDDKVFPSVTVMYEEPKMINVKVSDDETPPGWVQPVINDVIDELSEFQKEKEQLSVVSQITDLTKSSLEEFIDDEFEVEGGDIKEDGNGNITGSVKIVTKKLGGNFLFTATIEDNVVKNFDPEIDLIKGAYNIKKFQVDIGDREFVADAKDEVSAVKQVLSYLFEGDDDLVYDGRKFSSHDIDDVAKKISDTNTKVISIYPNMNVVAGEWKIVEKDGEKYFVRD